MRQIAVIGLGTFGSTVARQLAELGAEVLAIDRESQAVEAIKSDVAGAAALDATDEEALRAVAVPGMDAALVCIGDDVQANLLCTLLVRKMGVKVIWSRAINRLQAEILRALDVDAVMHIEAEMGRIIAKSLLEERIARHIDLGAGYGLAEIPVGEGRIGKTLEELHAGDRHEVQVVAVKQTGALPGGGKAGRVVTGVETAPDPARPLEAGDVLVCVGRDESLNRFSDA